MAKLTAHEYQEKHARRLKAATEDMRKGVLAVTEAPTLKAAAKKEKMRAGILNAIDNGKWENGLKKVTLEDWKTKMVDVGINRVSAGIDAAAPKVVSFAEKLLPHIDKGIAKIKSMPDVTLDDSINRMVAWTRHMTTLQK